MASQELKRVFIHDGEELSDPNRNYTVEKVISFYSNQFPSLVNGNISDTKINEEKGQIEYTIGTAIGTKG